VEGEVSRSRKENQGSCREEEEQGRVKALWVLHHPTIWPMGCSWARVLPKYEPFSRVPVLPVATRFPSVLTQSSNGYTLGCASQVATEPVM
jgi:hypothetical protein